MLALLEFILINEDIIICSNPRMELHIFVEAANLEPQWVRWNAYALNNTEHENKYWTGEGPWQKEKQSADAFSAYDEKTAISYKNNRAVFVYNDKDAEVMDCVSSSEQ